jgi:hypothetical protein
VVGPPERHADAAPRLHCPGEALGHEVIERLVNAVGKDDGGHRPLTGVVLLPLGAVLEQIALARMLVCHERIRPPEADAANRRACRRLPGTLCHAIGDLRRQF